MPLDGAATLLLDLLAAANVRRPWTGCAAGPSPGDVDALHQPLRQPLADRDQQLHQCPPNSSVYAASKAAVISLAKTLSAELLPRGVRVNVVSPGPVTTPIYGKLGLDAAALQATAAQIQSQIPLGRFGTAQEIASTVLHLSAPESAYIVGTEIIADGGMSQL